MPGSSSGVMVLTASFTKRSFTKYMPFVEIMALMWESEEVVGLGKRRMSEKRSRGAMEMVRIGGLKNREGILVINYFEWQNKKLTKFRVALG